MNQTDRPKWDNEDERDERIARMEKDAASNLEMIAEHAERIIELERLVNYPAQAKQGDKMNDSEMIDEIAERIERLEAATRGLAAIETTVALGHRIEKLETALQSVVRCLIDGKVDVDIDAETPGTMFHKHRILGSESVRAMVEVYHQLEK